MSRFLLFSLPLALVAPAAWAQSLNAYVSSAPGSVNCNDAFYIQATGDASSDSNDNYVTQVNVDLDGQYGASTSGWDYSLSCGSNATASSSPGTQYVNAQAWDSYGNYSSGSQAVTVNGVNHAPGVGISVDGHNSGDTVTRPYGGSVSITVRYTANDADGNLQGIRYNVWNATTGYFDNGGGGFIGTGGGSGEVDRSISLDSDGDWYFWTDAQDTAGAYSSTGAWQSGFHLVVVQGSPPNSPPSSSLSASSTSLTYGQSLTLTSTITDPDSNLSNQAVDLSTDNSSWASGWGNWSGQTAWNVSGGSATDTVNYTPPSAGTYYFRSRGQDTTGALSDFAYVTVTVNQAAMSPPTPNSSSYTISAGSSWSPLSDVNVPSGNGTGTVMWCVASYTNYNTGSWSPPGPGTYYFYVAQKADSNHYGNVNDPIQGAMEANGTLYTLNVAGTSTTFTFSGGPYTYDGAAKTVSVTPNPSNATYATSGTYSATNAGSYTATAAASGSFSGSGSYTWTINRAGQGTVAVSPSSTSAGIGQSVTFTASGGTGSGGYLWGGDASGTGPSATVTFSTTGTHYVTVYRQGDTNYNQSNTATATISVAQYNTNIPANVRSLLNLNPNSNATTDSTNGTVQLKVHKP